MLLKHHTVQEWNCQGGLQDSHDVVETAAIPVTGLGVRNLLILDVKNVSSSAIKSEKKNLTNQQLLSNDLMFVKPLNKNKFIFYL